MDTNPVIPFGANLALVIWLVLVATLTIAALVHAALRAKQMTPLLTVVWVAIIVVVPVIGPIAWFVIGRKSSSSGHAGQPSLL